MPPLAAIIMRSKNEMPHVQRALEMLQHQTFRDFELFAVDSGSTDGSLNLLRKHCKTGHLTQIAPANYAPGKVLNSAIARVENPIIVLLNADAVPLSKTWLETLLAPILGNRADATFSRQVARPDARFVVAYDYQRAYDPEKVEAPFFSAVACAFKRELWCNHKFREHGYAEDAEWARGCRIGGARIQLAAGSIVEHSHNYTFKELLQKHGRQAATLDEASSCGKQTFRCLREIVRDFFHALAKFKLHTIPYNLAYRIAIYRGRFLGHRDGKGKSPCG